MNSKKFAKTVIASILGAAVVGATASSLAASKKEGVVKCYGIAKKAKNDCGTSKHACAGQAKTNSAPDEWIFVMKGNCERITGGCTTPIKNGKCTDT